MNAKKTTEELLEEQNTLLRRQNELLEVANNKPTYAGPSDVEMNEFRAKRWDAQKGAFGRFWYQNPYRR